MQPRMLRMRSSRHLSLSSSSSFVVGVNGNRRQPRPQYAEIRPLIMASATRVLSERSIPPQHLRQGHCRTARYAASSPTPFPQYGDALAWDRGRGHVRDRRGRGTLSRPLLANSMPDCEPRLFYIIGPLIAAGQRKEGPGRAGAWAAASGTAVSLPSL